MDPKNFFAEMRRRNVYKVAAAYAVVAWFLIQAASIIFPAFDAPAWAFEGLDWSGGARFAGGSCSFLGI